MVEYLIRNIQPTLLDCNGNGIDDEQDIAEQTSQDDNGNGIPDECECPVECDSPQPEVIDDKVFPKNRYLSFEPGNAGRQAALRVKIVDLPAPFEYLEGEVMWVGVPWEVTENSGHIAPEDAPGWPTLTVATLQCEPRYADWGTYGILHVYHQNIIPGGRYAVQAIDEVCDIVGDPNYSWPLTIQTSIWADVVKDCTTTPCGPPDGEVYITADVTMILDKFKNLAGALAKARADIEPALPDLLINMTDVTWAVDAFGGGDYPFSAGAPCP
jgi:hypothetical protein